MTKENNLSPTEIANQLEKLARNIRERNETLDLVDRGLRGDGRDDYDFAGVLQFYKHSYPILEKLFYEIRGKGILGKYIKE